MICLKHATPETLMLSKRSSLCEVYHSPIKDVQSGEDKNVLVLGRNARFFFMPTSMSDLFSLLFMIVP
jgi:hypothetical protein